MNKVVVLDNIRSAHNVGSIFRTGDGAGVSRIYLVGLTPAPIDRFGRPRNEILKTSLGATSSVSWESVGDPSSYSTDELLELIKSLKNDGFTVVVVEQAKDSVSLDDFTAPKKVAYIFGAEVDGVQKRVIDEADVVLEIPMLGKKNH